MRRHLTLAVLLAVAAALLALSLGAFLVLSARLEGAAGTLLTTRADAVVATLASEGRRLTMLDTPADDTLDAGVWVFDGDGGSVVRAPGTPELQASVSALAGQGSDASEEVPGPMRLLARHVVLPDGVTGTVVVSLSLLPFEQTEHDALVVMVVFGLFVLLVTLAGTRLFLHVALRPVARMTDQAREWSEHAPERRFAMGPPGDELTALAATLDGLLARSEAALRYEQRLTAEIAHELRTPLTRARMVVELALRRPRPAQELTAALAEVQAEIGTTADALDALLASAAAVPGHPRGTGDAREASRLAVDAARRLPGAGRLTIEMVAADALPLAGCDTQHLVRTLAPLLDNAVHAADSAIRLELTNDQVTGEVVLAVTDDGPGMTDEEAVSVLEPGVRGRHRETRQGSGLGLALATRLARAAGGRVTITAGPGGHVELRVPAVPEMRPAGPTVLPAVGPASP